MPRRPSAAEARAERLAAWRRERVAEAEAAMAAAPDAAGVVVEALALVDHLAPILPTGGGFAIRSRAVPYADAVVHALTAYPKEFQPMPSHSPDALMKPSTGAVVDPFVSARHTALDALAAVRAEIDGLVDARRRLNDRVRQLRAQEASLASAVRAFDRVDGEPEPLPGTVRPSDDLDNEDAVADGLLLPAGDADGGIVDVPGVVS